MQLRLSATCLDLPLAGAAMAQFLCIMDSGQCAKRQTSEQNI